jgi:hypothetical protein
MHAFVEHASGGGVSGRLTDALCAPACDGGENDELPAHPDAPRTAAATAATTAKGARRVDIRYDPHQTKRQARIGRLSKTDIDRKLTQVYGRASSSVKARRQGQRSRVLRAKILALRQYFRSHGDIV